MRIFLMILGAVVSVGALLFWIYLNEMASAFNTSNVKSSMVWFSGEAVRLFWLPFVAGVGIIFVGWRDA